MQALFLYQVFVTLFTSFTVGVMTVAGCEDRVVRHWDTTTGLEVAQMTGHAGEQCLY